MTRFHDLLGENVLVADGGMGSMLYQLATTDFDCVDELNLIEPETVMEVHLRFIRAGATLIETNTFGANRLGLGRHGLADRCAEINNRAVKIAREAREVSGTDVLIAGSMGPGDVVGAQTPDASQVGAVYREQALALEDRGVDLFVLETFASIDVLEQACAAVRAVSRLPLLAQLTLPAANEWGEPGAGLPRDLESRLRRLVAIDADAIGLNCSLGPGEILAGLEALAALAPGRPLSVQPNSGLPRLDGGRFIYPRSAPEYYAWFAREAARLGARIIGGCCGTTPAQVAAVADAVRDLPATLEGITATEAPEPREPRAERRASDESALARRLRDGEFVISAQVDPPKGTNAERILEACEIFAQSGHVHCADVNSNPMARLHMDALWMSLAIERLGLETIPHYTPRDASLMGIEGNLLGAWSLGIRNILIITGDPSVVGGEPGHNDVYQTDSVGLVDHVRRLNEGIDCYGNTIGSPPNFTIGVAVNPNHEDLELEVERFRQKVANGAHFAMTQVFFEWSCWERFVDRLGGTLPIPVLIAVWPLTSHRLALRLHHEVPGILVPPDVLDLLERAGSGARAEGFALAREMLAEARHRAQGAYIIAPFKKPKAALELFE